MRVMQKVLLYWAQMGEALLMPTSTTTTPHGLVKGRDRRCFLVGSILAVATIVYLCGVILPMAEEDVLASKFQILKHNATSVESVQVEVAVETKQDDGEKGFVIYTPGCRIPDFAARNPLISEYVDELVPMPKCEEEWAPLADNLTQRGPPLVASNLTSLWVVHSSLPHYNVTKIEDLTCCYRPFTRVQQDPNEYSGSADDQHNMSSECVPFSGDSVIVDAEDEEYVRVECWAKVPSASNVSSESNSSEPTSREIYRDFHAFIPVKRKVEERCMQTSHHDDEVSVLVLGVDSVSRLNMERELPQLRDVMLSPPLDAIQLMGFNKVGDNTFPNNVALLMGMEESQLAAECPWPTAKDKLDPCPFLWKQFAKAGFRTGYGEDCTGMTTFNYGRTGFVQQPVDYYARPFLKAAEEEQGHLKLMNVKVCVGPRLSLANPLSYVRKFCERFAHERSFIFFWTNSMSHDYITMPHNADALYANMLRDLVQSGALDRTVVIVLSDHGMRWGGIRETYQGRIEERLPFAFLSFPKWFRDRYPSAVANVRRNGKNRLTTPFDLHETLLDLLDPSSSLSPDMLRERIQDLAIEQSNISASNFSSGNESTVSIRKGISLFLPVPLNRTCNDAFIPPHFCTCQESTPISTEESIVKRCVHFVIEDLNSRLRQYRQCAQLELNGIRSAQMNIPEENSQVSKEQAINDYLVLFETRPGGAVFEATVRENPPLTDDNKAKTTLQIVGGISRINLYGNQSHCVSDYHMKLYCFCT